jgi:hypothetical protein
MRMKDQLDAVIAEEVSMLRERRASAPGEFQGLFLRLEQRPVASRTLESVSQQFRDLVLRADVGIIDVAWARKQVETEKVNDLIKEQRERTQELEEEFADVLKD